MPSVTLFVIPSVTPLLVLGDRGDTSGATGSTFRARETSTAVRSRVRIPARHGRSLISSWRVFVELMRRVGVVTALGRWAL
ncbi:unnamed protein product [Phytomonas sp. EM1]|nr:unnamed protein product [Phytomonas sp. EM1]|eukprot:CCW63395.1 unnamed protein product [Phytomonas sp. isolate EM1]